MDTKLSKATSPGLTLKSAVEDVARKAGEIALGYFHSLSGIAVEEKGHLDLVTKADKEVESFLVASLHKLFPEDGIYGEEGGDITGSSGRTWVIDPIDGTFNFVRGGNNWAISIGLFANKRPIFGVIYAPIYDLMLSGGEEVETEMNGKPMEPLPLFNLSRASMSIGIHPTIPTKDRLELLRYISDELCITFRCNGATTASLIEVATGQTDGYLSLGDSTWDVMAGLPILKNLGLDHTIDWDATNLNEKLRFACGSKEFLEKVRPLLKNVNATIAAF